MAVEGLTEPLGAILLSLLIICHDNVARTNLSCASSHPIGTTMANAVLSKLSRTPFIHTVNGLVTPSWHKVPIDFSPGVISNYYSLLFQEKINELPGKNYPKSNHHGVRSMSRL